MEILLFGAGASGRGHLNVQIHSKCGAAHVIFTDKNKRLVDLLNKAQSYKVRLLSMDNSERTISLNNFNIKERDDEEALIEAFLKADLVLTCVIAENLENISLVIAKGIEKRMQTAKNIPLNIIACENLNNASKLLSELVLNNLGTDVVEYTDKYIGFPDCMISCVVPVPTDDLFLVAEDYNEWVVRKSKFKGDCCEFPFLNVIDNFDAYLERKLWIHNGGHATVGYAGYQSGYKYIHEAVADENIAQFTVAVMHQIGDAVIHKYGFDKNETRKYESNFCKRGAIKEMKDSILRVVRNPLRKLGLSDRLMGPALYAYKNNLPYDMILKSLVNITFYENDTDSEVVKMQKDIKQYGFEKFCETTLDLKGYPDFIKEFSDLRSRLKNGTV